MATSNEYLIYVLDLLRETNRVTYKKMMGEYILYQNNVIFGGIYDDRFLIKKVDGLDKYHFKEAIPYPSGKPMLLVDIDGPDEIKEIVDIIVLNIK